MVRRALNARDGKMPRPGGHAVRVSRASPAGRTQPGSNPKRVLFLCSIFCSRALKEYLQLQKRGFDVTVGHLGGSNNRVQYVKKAVRYEYSDKGVRDIISKVRPSIVHVHNTPNSHGIWARNHFDGTVIFDVHDARPQGQDKAIAGATYVYTVHNRYAKWMRQKFAIRKPIHACHSVYWIDGFGPLPKLSDDGEYHLGFIGSMYTPQTANAWSRKFKQVANRSKIHIHVHVNVFKDIVDKYTDDWYHLEPEIMFMDVPRVLSQYDAGIIPSGTADSFPNKFFDYTNAGIPTIVEPGRKLVADTVKANGFGCSSTIEDITRDVVDSVVGCEVDHNRLKNIRLVDQLPPYKGLL